LLVLPGTEAKLITKSQNLQQMKNRITSAETAAQQSDAAEVPMSSQPCSNTFVSGCFLSSGSFCLLIQLITTNYLRFV